MQPASGSPFPLKYRRELRRVRRVVADGHLLVHVALNGFAIAITKYEAFGDSLTAGETGRATLLPQDDDVPERLPDKTAAGVRCTYPGQGIVVINKGHNGDVVADHESHPPRRAAGDRPGAVLSWRVTTI